MYSINLSDVKGRAFYFSYPERFKGMTNVEGHLVESLPARELVCVAFPPDIEGAPKKSPNEGGWSGSISGRTKLGIDYPWDGKTWGKIPSVLDEDFSPLAPILFGEAFPMSKNELFPIIKKTRTLLGRDFYGFYLFYGVKILGDIIESTIYERFTLAGEFSDGFEGKPVIDIQGTAL